jgi:hypothetical protein
MFEEILPKERNEELLKIVRLLQVFEAPLMWGGGKTENELTTVTDLDDIKFSISNSLEQAWENTTRIYGDETDHKDTTDIIKELLNRIRKRRVTFLNDKGELLMLSPDKDERLKLATIVLQENLCEIAEKQKRVNDVMTSIYGEAIAARHKNQNIKSFSPKNSRIVLFEAMRLSLHVGGLNDSKKKLLQVVSALYDIDEESFNELLAQAIALNKEIKRSINLVLE